METASTVSLNEAAAPHEASNFSGRSVILEQDLAKRLSTGVTQLDEIMRGGYVPRRSYMIRGDPGAGKTTVGLHFLVAGAAGGEMTLYITVGGHFLTPQNEVNCSLTRLAPSSRSSVDDAFD